MVGALLDPELDLGDPFLSRLLGVGAEHESPSGSSDFEETRFLSFFGRVGHGRALRNFYHIRQVYCAFAAVVATIVVVTNLENQIFIILFPIFSNVRLVGVRISFALYLVSHVV